PAPWADPAWARHGGYRAREDGSGPRNRTTGGRETDRNRTGPKAVEPDSLHAAREESPGVCSQGSQGPQSHLRRNRRYPAWFAPGRRRGRSAGAEKPWSGYRGDQAVCFTRTRSQLPATTGT